MHPKNVKDSAEELVIKFLKKNTNFFINYPEVLKELNFPDKTPASEKIIDLSAYRSKKISNYENSASIIKGPQQNRCGQRYTSRRNNWQRFLS